MSAAAALIEVAQGRAAPGAVVIGGRVADVYAGEFVAANVDDPRLLQAIAATRAPRRRAEGHAAGASYDRLAALAAAGIGSDHEAITAAEARARVALGLWTMLRRSSLRPDLRALLDGLGDVVSTCRRLMLTALDGLATSFTTSMQLLVLGRDARAMARAAARVAELGGGIAIASAGGVAWEAPLPVLGMIGAGAFADAVAIEDQLGRRARAAGYRFRDVLYTLLFATGDFLPDLRLTPAGLLDVKSGEVLAAPVRLGAGG